MQGMQSVLSKILNLGNKSINKNVIRSIVQVSQDSAKQDVHEVTIPVPWGYVAGKWWGDKDSKKRPILALHGWQDNAGTFDLLIPYITSDRPILAIDFPGHGWSSPIYPAMVYHEIDTVLLVRRIQKHYEWDKISFLTHSMGGITSFLYAALYPEYVDFAINLDLAKPIEADIEKRLDDMGSVIDKMIDLMKRSPSSKGWKSDDLKERWVKGTGNSLTHESVEILMKRGIKEIKPGKFVFTRDCRLKAYQLQRFEPSETIKFAKNIKNHILLINGEQSPFFELSTLRCPEFIPTLEENAKINSKVFKVVTTPGTHHFHLSSPEEVAKIIDQFIYITDYKDFKK